jgi:hypothetical protein
MTSVELHQALIDLDFIEGYIILDGLIIDWSNTDPIPKSLADFVALEVN